jgi:hypothetical protein
MKRFIKWQEDMFNKTEAPEVKEGVNPTDVDSAGMDQDLDNAGVPYDLKTAEELASGDRGRDEAERDYQLQIFQMMIKSTPKDDPNDIDPTQGPQGHTSGGSVDKAIMDFLKKSYEDKDEKAKDVEKLRGRIPVKTISTAFRQDRKVARNDINPEGGNADKSNDVLDEE